MSLIAVTTSQGLSVISSSALQASNPNPAPIFTAALTPPSRIPSSCISWSYDGSSIFVASGGSVSAYDPTSGAWLRDVIREGEGGIGGAKLGAMAVIDGPDTPGLMLALARGPRAVIFDTEARRAVLTIEGHKSSIQAMSVTCDQSLLATCSGDSTMVTNIPQQSTVVLRGAPAGALAAAFHPSRRTTLLILSPKGLHVFDTTKGGAPIRTIPISKVEGTSASIAFSSSTSSLVAVALPGRDSRVVLLDIDKDSSLLKKFNVEENVTAMSFSHDGATIIVTSETGRVMQLNLRSTDAPSQAVAVDPAGGRIGGMALVAESPTSSNTLPRARPARTDSLPNLPTADSLRIKASVSDLRGGTLRKRPSTLDIGPKSPESPRISSPETLRNRSPQLARTKSSVADLHKRSPSGDLKTKVSPGALRVKAGVENKVRPTSMISAGSGKERVRVRPMSLVDQQSEGEGLSKATRDTISRASRPSLADLKTAAGTPSPGSKVSSANGSPLTKNDRESTISPTSRRQTQTMPRRLTSDGSRPPTIAQIFAQDDAASTMRTRSPSQSTVPLSAVSSQSSLSNGRSTPLSTRPSLRSTTPNYTPGVPAGSATSDEPEEQILVPRPGDRERPWSRLGEERARSRLGNETPKLPTLPAIEDRPRSRIGTEDRPRSRAFEDRLVSESERERPSSRLFRDGTDRPASRAGTLGASGSATLGLGRPTGLARRFSTDLKPAPEAMRVVSESGITRERAETFGSLRDRPEPVLKKRASAIFREQSDALFRERERERSSTPLSGSSTRNSGKRVGWVDTESPYVSAPLDTIYTPARPRSGLANNSVSGSNSSDEDESDCAHRGSNALLVTPRRGLAAALGAEVYAGETPTNKGNSTSMTKTQAQDLLRNIVSDVMFEFRQETKEDVRGLHLDLLRASRGWKSDLKEYLGDTLEELRLVKEENARLRAEIARLRRGY